jgi:hypothetical protein
MDRLIRHVRGNAVAYLALFVALGGTGYAAINLPAGSVGAKQIRNHVIGRVKLDPSLISGSVRVWAHVSAAGRMLAGSSGITIGPEGAIAGDYVVNPSRGSKIARPSGCAAIASVDDNSVTSGYAEAEVGVFPKGEAEPWQVFVRTFDPQGAATPLPFDFAVIC